MNFGKKLDEEILKEVMGNKEVREAFLRTEALPC
jgi:hypothetical protein